MKRTFCDLCKKELESREDTVRFQAKIRYCGYVDEISREVCDGCLKKVFEDVYDDVHRKAEERQKRLELHKMERERENIK